MAIVSSTIISQNTQIDGRVYVREKHVDHLTKEYFIEYLADLGEDINANLATHAAQIWQNLIDSEIEKRVGELEQGILASPGIWDGQYAEKLTIVKRLVKRALRMETIDAFKALTLMDWVFSTYTVAQIAAFLGVSSTVVNAVKTRFTNIKNNIKPLVDTDGTKVVEIE